MKIYVCSFRFYLKSLPPIVRLLKPILRPLTFWNGVSWGVRIIQIPIRDAPKYAKQMLLVTVCFVSNLLYIHVRLLFSSPTTCTPTAAATSINMTETTWTG